MRYWEYSVDLLFSVQTPARPCKFVSQLNAFVSCLVFLSLFFLFTTSFCKEHCSLDFSIILKFWWALNPGLLYYLKVLMSIFFKEVRGTKMQRERTKHNNYYLLVIFVYLIPISELSFIDICRSAYVLLCFKIK